MKKLFMFLTSVVFLTQAHAMEGENYYHSSQQSKKMNNKEQSKKDQIRRRALARIKRIESEKRYAAEETRQNMLSKASIGEESIFSVDNQSTSQVSIIAAVTGAEFSYGGTPNRIFSIREINPGEVKNCKRRDLGHEFATGKGSLSRIERVTILSKNAPVEMGQHCTYVIGQTLIVTDALLKKTGE